MVSFTTTRGRLRLRSPCAADADNILARLQDSECVQYIPGLRDRQFTLQGVQQQIERWLDESAKTSLFLMIESISDDVCIGDGGFESLSFIGDEKVDSGETRTGDIGVILDRSPNVRGMGYAVEALNGMMEHGFRKLDLHMIRLRTLKSNEPMMSLMRKHFSGVQHMFSGAICEILESETMSKHGPEVCFEARLRPEQ